MGYKSYTLQLPSTGPLASPLLRSYIRKQILSIRRHYKDTYFKCNNTFMDGPLSWYAIYSLVIRSAIDLKLFTVFFCIISVTDMGETAMPLEKFFTTFRGVFSKYYLTKCRRKLENIGYIKTYNYNPFDPSGPCKHLALTGKGVQFYKSFVLALRNYILSPLDEQEDPDYPAVLRSHLSDGKILRF